MGVWKFTDKEVLDAWEKVKQGKTIKEVALEMGYANANGSRLGQRIKKLVSKKEYKTYIDYARRRPKEKRKRDIKKAIKLLDSGLSIAQIAKRLGLSYHQVHEDLHNNYKDPKMYKILIQNYRSHWNGYRILTRKDVDKVREMAESLPAQTVANIMGISKDRARGIVGKKYRGRANLHLFALVGQWLLARFLVSRYPQKKWHLTECINISKSDLCPDLWTEDEWWDSKATLGIPSIHKDLCKTQLYEYLKYTSKRNRCVLVWNT